MPPGHLMDSLRSSQAPDFSQRLWAAGTATCWQGLDVQAADLQPGRILFLSCSLGVRFLELFVQVYVEGHCVGQSDSWGRPFVRMQMA